MGVQQVAQQRADDRQTPERGGAAGIEVRQHERQRDGAGAVTGGKTFAIVGMPPVGPEEPACLLAPGQGELTEQERLAVQFLDLLSADHHAIDDDVYRELGKVFTAAQIIELGFACANSMGLHRFIHTLDVYGTSEPVIAFSADQVDSVKETASPADVS